MKICCNCEYCQVSFALPRKYRCAITEDYVRYSQECNLDLAAVVRCRDCYHFHIVNQPYDENWCTVMEGCVDPDGYCYKGERRDDDTD